VADAQAANDRAADKIESLEQTLFELRGDIASGDHVPPGTRVLTMRENPFQQWSDLRQEVVDRLKSENDALLKRLKDLEASGATSGSGGEHLVPRESWEKEHKEKCDLEEVVRQKEKRLLRLQQVRPVLLPKIASQSNYIHSGV
jgi:mitotic spindle assembly checkpoint protein MAD1